MTITYKIPLDNNKDSSNAELDNRELTDKINCLQRSVANLRRDKST